MIITTGFGKENKGEREQGFITECSRMISERHPPGLFMELNIIKYSHEWPWPFMPKNVLMKSVNGTVGGIFSTVAKYSIKKGKNRLLYKID